VMGKMFKDEKKKVNVESNLCLLVEFMHIFWRAPNSLRDSNVSLNWKQLKSKKSGHAPWLATLWRGRGACWSSGMGLGRIDKLQLLTQTCTKSTQGG
jgi:hypothetical protein